MTISRSKCSNLALACALMATAVIASTAAYAQQAAADSTAVTNEGCTLKGGSGNNATLCITYSNGKSECQMTIISGELEKGNANNGTPPNKDRICRDVNNIAQPDCKKITVTPLSGTSNKWCLNCDGSTGTVGSDGDCPKDKNAKSLLEFDRFDGGRARGIEF